MIFFSSIGILPPVVERFKGNANSYFELLFLDHMHQCSDIKC